MATPKTKTQLNTLITDYIADGSPNITFQEHREIELAILDRVDARILATGTFLHPNNPGFLAVTGSFSKTLYTTNYLVHIVAITNSTYPYSHQTSVAVTNKTTTGFTAQCKRNYRQGPGKFHFVVVNLANNI